jgi:multidrug efflux pump
MTTAATVFGVVPLVTATGAGAASRFNMGLVIMTGISIGTLFTLFVVPAMYLFMAVDLSRAPSKASDLINTPPEASLPPQPEPQEGEKALV